MKYMCKIQGQLRIIHESMVTRTGYDELYTPTELSHPINPIHHIQDFLAYGGLVFSAPLPPLELKKIPLQEQRVNKSYLLYSLHNNSQSSDQVQE